MILTRMDEINVMMAGEHFSKLLNFSFSLSFSSSVSLVY